MESVLEREKKAILQEPIIIEVDVKNRFKNGPFAKPERWLRKKGLLKSSRIFEINDLVTGTVMQISVLLSKIGFDTAIASNDSQAFKDIIGFIAENKDTIVQVVAHAIHGGPGNPSKKLVSFLTWNLDHSDMYTVLTAIVRRMNLQDFLRSMLFVGTLNLMEGRQQTAPIGGESSDQSKNTLAAD